MEFEYQIVQETGAAGEVVLTGSKTGMFFTLYSLHKTRLYGKGITF